MALARRTEGSARKKMLESVNERMPILRGIASRIYPWRGKFQGEHYIRTYISDKDNFREEYDKHLE